MTDYELLYIVASSFTDEELSTIEASVGDMLTKVGITAVKTERLGKFRLAYPIKRQEYGHYIIVRFQAETSMLADLNNLIRLSPDRVLRHLILRADEVGDEKYNLVPFQPVNVESRDDRSRKPRRTFREDGETSPTEGVVSVKEGVAVLEGRAKDTAASKPVDTLTEEDVDKKIDEALGDKA